MPTATDLLKKYDIHPLKRLGQSFLIDPNIIAKIVRTADIRPDDLVIEIGAGLGVMTALLAERAKRVIAVEIDPVMIAILRNELKGFSNIEIVHTDILKYDIRSALRGAAPDSTLKVVGNIPYNISTQILFRLIDCRTVLSGADLMFQEEVADRVIAPPGGKDYGILSVLAGMFADISRTLSVPASCFYPVPKVDSAVLKIVFRDAPLVALHNPEFFLKVVKAAFSKRRKTLFNCLKTAPTLALQVSALESALYRAGINGKRRGETLSIEEFGELANAIFEVQSSEFRVQS